MGFFGNFNSIGKIYGHLRKIEPIFNEIMVGQRAAIDKTYCNSLAHNIIAEISELRKLVESSGNTVKCANYQFMGSIKSIYHIMADIEMLTNTAKNRLI